MSAACLRRLICLKKKCTAGQALRRRRKLRHELEMAGRIKTVLEMIKFEHSVFAFALFFVAAWQLNLLALKLAPLAIAILFFYSFTKRFTSWSHLFLGFALGISPAAAWIAITGGLDSRMLILCGAVTLWVGGFDVLYACQDVDFDQQAGLFSVPKRFGIANALLIARAMHAGVIGLLGWLAFSFGLPWPAWMGIAVVAALLAYEHSLVKANDLSKLDAAFFAVNGYISMLFLLFWGAAAAFWRV